MLGCPRLVLAACSTLWELNPKYSNKHKWDTERFIFFFFSDFVYDNIAPDLICKYSL